MFTILMKDVDGRRSYRYFKKWENAEKAMMRDIASVKKITEIVLEEQVDRMNGDFYEREAKLVSRFGMLFHYALIDGYFEDNND